MSQVKPRVINGYTMPPGPPPTLNPKKLLDIITKPVKMTGMGREYGDFVLITAKPLLTYAVYHPELLRVVLEDYEHIAIRGFTGHFNKNTSGEALRDTHGEKRRKLRAQVQPVLSHRPIVEELAPAMTEIPNRFQAEWVNGSTIDMKREMEEMMLRVHARSMFGLDFETDDAFRDVALAMETYIRQRNYLPPPLAALLYKLPLPETLRIKRETARAHQMLSDFIVERGPDSGGLVPLLLKSQDPQTGDPMTELEVRTEFLSWLITAHHILAGQLMWIWHLTATQPEAADKLYAEIDEVLGDRLPTLEDLPKLRATHQFILEALRFSPAFYMDMREITDDIEIAGYRIPPNSAVAIPLIWIHRDPRWWDEPEKFKPERWKPGFRESLPPYTYNVFLSDAPVSCVAEHYSMMVMTFAMTTIGRNWRMKMPEGFKFKTIHTFNRSVKGPMSMILERRNGK